MITDHSGARSVEAGAGALAPYAGTVRARIRPSVFSEGFVDLEAPALTSVQDIVRMAGLAIPDGLDGVAWIDGRRLPARYWHRVRPKAGAVVSIAFLPRDARTGLLIGGALALAVGAAFLGRRSARRGRWDVGQLRSGASPRAGSALVASRSRRWTMPRRRWHG